MGKTKNASNIRITLRKAGRAAGSAAARLKAAVREFFIKVNPGP